MEIGDLEEVWEVEQDETHAPPSEVPEEVPETVPAEEEPVPAGV